MILYIFAIWLVSCYSSSGAPASIASSGAPTPNVNASDYSVALSNLVSSCENPFLSGQIKNKLKDCPTLVPPYRETEFQCMLFYDINRQLCSAVASNTIALSGNYTASINAPQDIVQLCNAAKGWTFSSLGEEYIKSAKFVFADVLRCAKICSDDNAGVIDIKSNFYCNYFKWGSDLLQANKKPPTGVAPGVVAPNSIAVSGSNSKVKPVGPTSVVLPNSKNNLTAVPLNVQTSIDSHLDNDAKLQAIDQKGTSEKATSINTGNAEGHVETPVEQNPSEMLTASDGPKDKAADDKKIKDNENNNISDQEQAANIPPPPEGHVDEIVDKSPKSDKNDEIKAKLSGDTKKDNSANEAINSQLQVPKNDVGDVDDYQNELDSDEARSLSDTQGIDDGDDPAVGDPDLLKDLDQHKKKNEPQLTDISQKEFYPNTITDGFPEEDDHFFPFFLTAIVMVILLYVLYHNKSKVSKVIMGLIVEGRQPGRRRNSRGHAYKRLDTLEQAMSTNSSAPPSKIIY